VLAPSSGFDAPSAVESATAATAAADSAVIVAAMAIAMMATITNTMRTAADLMMIEGCDGCVSAPESEPQDSFLAFASTDFESSLTDDLLFGTSSSASS
jgi:hypothetical protein